MRFRLECLDCVSRFRFLLRIIAVPLHSSHRRAPRSARSSARKLEHSPPAGSLDSCITPAPALPMKPYRRSCDRLGLLHPSKLRCPRVAVVVTCLPLLASSALGRLLGWWCAVGRHSACICFHGGTGRTSRTQQVVPSAIMGPIANNCSSSVLKLWPRFALNVVTKTCFHSQQSYDSLSVVNVAFEHAPGSSKLVTI